MLFKWVDYCEKYEDEIETWMSDELILRYATDGGIKKDHEYYLSSNEYKYNKEYFCKVILEENTIIAVVIILRGDKFPIGINPIIVNPQYRNKGYCTRIIDDFINNTNNIIGFDGNIIEAGIDLSNKSSIKAFEKNGFVLAGMHKSGDFTYWVYPAVELKNYRKYCADSMKDDFIALSEF